MSSGPPVAIAARLAQAPALLIVCEFDGTIAEFVNDPAVARPVGGALDVLTTLGSLLRTRAAVISGRSLDSLRAVCMTGRTDGSSCGIELIGSGGMEIDSQLTLGLTAEARRMRRRLLVAAGQVAELHPGVTVDEKPYGVALHVRGVAAADAQNATALLLDIARTLPQRVYSQSRNDVLDLSVLPLGQDWAIDALRQGSGETVFYAGNDERALASLSGPDVGCSVGGCTNATFFLQRPEEVVQFLIELGHARQRVLSDSGTRGV